MRIPVAFAIAAVALLLRLVFFEGLWPADAVHYVMYASQWDHIPRNHWETRLFYTGSLRAAILAFGCGEHALALPSLIPSLITTVLTIVTASRLWTLRAGVIAGLLVATVPVDVAFSTAPLPGCMATMFIAAGTACFLLDDIPWRNYLGPACFALAMLTHLTSLFLVGTLFGASLAFATAREERRRSIVWLVASCALYFSIEFAIYGLIAGDPLYEFKIIPLTSPRFDPDVATFSPAWFLWPMVTWLLSKDFGLTTLALSILSVYYWRSEPRTVRILVVAIVAFWLWIGYGSQSPFEFRPFWRSARFAQTFIGPMFIALSYLLSRMNWKGTAITGGLVATNLLLAASSGTWAQDVKINRDLLPAIRSASDVGVVTDAPTRDELYVLNGCRYPSNVITSDDPNARNFARFGAILNPLSGQGVPAGFVADRPIAVTQVHYRAVAYVLPRQIRERIGWLRRRPAGALVLLRRADS